MDALLHYVVCPEAGRDMSREWIRSILKEELAVKSFQVWPLLIVCYICYCKPCSNRDRSCGMYAVGYMNQHGIQQHQEARDLRRVRLSREDEREVVTFMYAFRIIMVYKR